MSYVPYTPEAPPAVSEPARAPMSAGKKWILGIGIYLIGVALWVVWMKMPRPIQPPLAAAALGGAGDRELRLIGAFADLPPYFDDDYDFEGRYRRGRSEQFSTSRLNAPNAELVLAFSRYSPATKTFSGPGIKSVVLREPGVNFGIFAEYANGAGAQSSIDLFGFSVVPRRTPKLTLRVELPGRTVEMEMANPLYAADAENLKPEPMPVKKSVIDQEVILDSVKLQKSSVSQNGQPQWLARPMMKFPGAPPNSFSWSWEWQDATGNQTVNGVLPFSESAWKLNVRVRETSQKEFPPDRIMTIGEFTVPAAESVVPIKLPEAMVKAGFRDMMLVGSGSYQLRGNKLQLTGAKAGKVVATFGQFVSNRSIVNPSWALMSVSESGASMRDGNWIVRLRRDGKICHPSSTGSSTSGSGKIEHAMSFRDSVGEVLPGAKVTVEVIQAQSGMVSFVVPPPAPPVDGGP